MTTPALRDVNTLMGKTLLKGEINPILKTAFQKGLIPANSLQWKITNVMLQIEAENKSLDVVSLCEKFRVNFGDEEFKRMNLVMFLVDVINRADESE